MVLPCCRPWTYSATASGHLQWMLPVGQGLELGVSGAIGPQDKQPDVGIAQWHVGLDARLTRGQLVLSGAITDGNMMDHRFEREHSLHSTWVPNVAGHVQYKIPFGHGLKVGISAAAGPQDDQPSTDVAQWHIGADVALTDYHGWDVVAEYVQGLQQGQTRLLPCDVTACLTYKGAYVLVDRRIAPWITPYVRVDVRDAVHTHGADFVYESHVARATVGLHFEMTTRILAKIEYTFNRELDGIPQFADDIVTSSLVVATD